MDILIIGIGSNREWGLQSLARAGHRIGVIDQLHKIPVDLVDWYRVANPGDLAAVLDLNDVPGWDALLCWDEMSVEVASQLATQWRIPGPALNVNNFRDKAQMREALRAAGLAVPRFLPVSSLEEALAQVGALRWPLVLKPVDYAGSSGVILLQNEAELSAQFGHALARSPRKKCILEEYIEGVEVSVEVVTWGKGRHQTLGVTHKQITAPPYFIELGHTFPAQLPAGEQAEIERVVHQALDALAMERGASHAELKLTPDGPRIIEVGGRLAGDFIPKLVWLSTGVNPYLLELAAIRQDAPPAETGRHAELTSAVRFLTAQAGQQIAWPAAAAWTRIPDLDATLHDLKYWHPTYAATPVLNSNGRRLGYCMLTGERQRVDRVMRQIDDLMAAHLSDPVRP
jgi:biotin carboxylase